MTATRANSLTAQALAGTAHSAHTPPLSGAPVDGLKLPGEDAGRDLLLRAGAAAIYRAAGRLPARGVAPLEVAGPESRALCPPEAAARVEALIVTGLDSVLLEALARMTRRGDLLPPSLLPLALQKARAFATTEMRVALAPVVGERGRWLARHNPDWSWLLERTLPGEPDALPPDAETIWQEGTTGQRVALLGRLRAHDPARAREWLEGVWKQEKAETRASMLNELSTGLSLDDEPLLEAALDDRGKSVRQEAGGLLARLTGSALSRRIRERADSALAYDGVTLEGHPPIETDASWARDGLPTEAIHGEGGLRATLLQGLIERTPPAHWSQRFGADPATLIAATAKAVWRSPIFSGWTAAALTFSDRAWASALWDAWLALEPGELKEIAARRLTYLRSLARLVPLDRLEALALRVIADNDAYEGVSLADALGFLERPWSVAVARAFLESMREFAAAKAANPQLGGAIWGAFELGASAMPEALFAEARQPITIPEANDWRVTQFIKQCETFAEIVRLRDRIGKVLPL